MLSSYVQQHAFRGWEHRFGEKNAEGGVGVYLRAVDSIW